MSSIKLSHVNKYYYSSGQLTYAVQDLNMDIADGEFISIVGPSGCGKSSTMRMIAGLEGITSGTLEFDGKVVNKLQAAERNTALSFESYALYQHMSVRENIGFCMKAKGMKPEEISKRTDTIIELFGIGDIAEKKPFGLSGGQQQLVSLARALVRKPSVALLDEPISHLDLRARQDVSMKIREIHNELGLTMIYVTHNQEEAFALADRIAVMDFGKLLQIGRREEILENPRNTFVAEFVGEPSMNFVHCTTIVDNDKRKLIAKEEPRIAFPIARELAAIAQNYSELTVGMRPIHCKLEKRGAIDEIELRGEVFLYELLGENAIIKIRMGSYIISADISPDVKPAIGSIISLYVTADNLHYFDTKTGTSLRYI